MLRFSAALMLALLTGAATAQDTPEAVNAALTKPLPADQAAMKAHVLFLASDAMRGREAGSPEYDIAAQYVAAQFYAAGLKPGGDAGGYLQQVPFAAYRLDGPGSFAWTPRGGTAQPLLAGDDFTASANGAKAVTRVSAPVVFVGHGVTAPQYGHDDYRNVDVRGKIVAVVNGAPAGFGGEEYAFFASGGTKGKNAQAHGAVGMITVSTRTTPVRPAAAPTATPGATRGPQPAVQPAAPVPARGPARIGWANPDGTAKVEAPGAPTLGTLSATGAAKLFGADWAKVTAAAALGDKARYPTLRPAGVLTVETRTSFEKAASSNVVGIIPGSDPKVGREVVILSAHLDHIGVSTRGEDKINNGALDNAIGIASLIEEAKRFTASGQAPRRTIMFLAVTAEEKGLVGSDYFANHPTVPLERIVANVNLDMPILTYRFEDMVVFGAERSTLGPIVRRAVESAGVGLSPDPMPREGIFVRSDHFRFVQKGVPSVFLWPGQKGAGAKAVADFMGKCYHRPCDELAQQPILWDQGVRFVDVNYRIAREIADGPARPVWNKGDYFGTLYKGPMAR
ncbi:M28 family peptidase [Sphingomonas sp.]|jgi:Zn-dependent M28 family amino/carboxypeptidase|uniref:M28 family peptidase n=1 Tax=Sphingomonas sp. TaxID=28214 RepID=UPI002D7FAD31|nr:M28 family peptidase [Sphingomonas sp.]HEU0045827.1 M28 family peptidase [Sphingomonas sp.]